MAKNKLLVARWLGWEKDYKTFKGDLKVMGLSSNGIFLFPDGVGGYTNLCIMFRLLEIYI